MQPDKKNCYTKPKEYLVYAQNRWLRMMALDTEYKTNVILPLPQVQNVVALDVDPVSGESVDLVF